MIRRPSVLAALSLLMTRPLLHAADAPDTAFASIASLQQQMEAGKLTSQALARQFLDRIRRGARHPEAIGVWIANGLRDGSQREQVQCLHRAVSHRRDAKRS